MTGQRVNFEAEKRLVSVAVGGSMSTGVVTEYPRVTVTVTVKGRGRVTGGPINCPARCKARIGSGTKLKLRASAARGYRFAGWRGACTGRRACILYPSAAVKVTAIFGKRRL